MDFRQLKAIESVHKKKLLQLFPSLTDESGIYILYRFEDGFKYAYVGQAKKILTRLVSHMRGYQHIDLSIKKHGWYSEVNKTGWLVSSFKCPENELDEREQFYIRECARAGYQLRNKTAGGQGEGKTQIDDFKPAKGYYDGLEQGRKKLLRELNNLFEHYLCVEMKKDNLISQRMLKKFNDLLLEGQQTKKEK